jgi:high affinity Mn2+ porin
LAGAINRVSHEGKLYLAAGGLGGIDGDGQLPNAGRKQVLEAYYHVAVFSLPNSRPTISSSTTRPTTATCGPVSIFGLQLHLQY